MKLVDELFIGYDVINNNLINYGFLYIDNIYKYNKKIYNDSFELRIIINDNKIDAKLIDLDFNEEYEQININGSNNFIEILKDECKNILIDIRNNCFIKNDFLTTQANRINKIIIDKYKVEAESLWEKFPNHKVYRNKRSEKWFALIMNISKNKLDNINNIDNIEIINLNLGDLSKNYIDNINIFNAYHMNKNNWVSVILDDKLDDDKILKLIDISYNNSNISSTWLIPANPKYYDVLNMFNNNDIASWKQASNILIGDIIYLYVATPINAIKFKCEVIENNIPYEYIDKNLKINKLMKIKLLKEYDNNLYTFKKLNELGIKAIRGARRIAPDLINE